MVDMVCVGNDSILGRAPATSVPLDCIVKERSEADVPGLAHQSRCGKAGSFRKRPQQFVSRRDPFLAENLGRSVSNVGLTMRIHPGQCDCDMRQVKGRARLFCFHQTMELPSVGANCALSLCRSLSFLPFQCPFCSKVHCPEHRLPQDHVCSQWSMESHANSVHLCPKCERMVLVPKQHDSATVVWHSP